MARLVFGMNQSLDGYVDHLAFAPSPTLFRHFIEEALGQAGSVYGRQMYEVMRYWDDDHPEWDTEEHAFAAAWRNQPKWVVSRSLPRRRRASGLRREARAELGTRGGRELGGAGVPALERASAFPVRACGPRSGTALRWIAAAIPLALAAVVVLYVAGVENTAVLVVIPFIAFVLVGIIDRDGWRIRMAMAEVAARQREHWRTGTLPIDPPSADAWLREHPDARPAERASVLVTAGRREEAVALLDAAVGETPTETVGSPPQADA